MAYPLDEIEYFIVRVYVPRSDSLGLKVNKGKANYSTMSQFNHSIIKLGELKIRLHIVKEKPSLNQIKRLPPSKQIPKYNK